MCLVRGRLYLRDDLLSLPLYEIRRARDGARIVFAPFIQYRKDQNSCRKYAVFAYAELVFVKENIMSKKWTAGAKANIENGRENSVPIFWLYSMCDRRFRSKRLVCEYYLIGSGRLLYIYHNAILICIYIEHSRYLWCRSPLTRGNVYLKFRCLLLTKVYNPS